MSGEEMTPPEAQEWAEDVFRKTMADRGITVRRAGMSGKETVRALGDEREARRVALNDNIREAQGAMASAGYSVADHDTPLDMVKKLLDRNQQQQGLADGLRERLKAVDAVEAVCEVNTDLGTECPFHITVGGCNARRSEENGDWCRCAEEPRSPDFPDQYPERPPCRLDEGPILVKKAESEESDGPEKLSGLAAAVEEAHRANGVYLLHCVKEWIDRRRATPEGGES